MNPTNRVAPKQSFSTNLCAALAVWGAACSPSGKGAVEAGAAGSDMALSGMPIADAASPEDAGPAMVDFVSLAVVSTLAGSEMSGGQQGTGASAQFNNPTGIALDTSGNLYVAEYDGSRLRKVTPAGATSTLTHQMGFVGPFGVAFAAPDQLLVETDFDRTGVKTLSSGTLWTVPLSTGVATMLVGDLGRPRGVAHVSAKTIVVADRTRQTISLLDSDSGMLTPLASSIGNAGFVNGKGTSARFDAPIGAAAMPDSSIIVADSNNHCLRRVLADGTVTTFSGNGVKGMMDGPSASARFDRPIAVAIDAAGVVYVSDQGDNHRIRRVNPSGMVETVAGEGVAGFADGSGDHSEFYGQEGLAVLPSGKILYVADGNSGDGSMHHRLRKITLP